MLANFLVYLHGLQSRAEKTFHHRKAVRSLSSCLYEPLRLSILEKYRSESPFPSGGLVWSGCQMTFPLYIMAWPVKVTPFANIDPPLQSSPLTDLGPGGVFFFSGLE